MLGIAFILFAKPYFSFMGDMLESSWTSNQNPEDLDAALAIFTGMVKFILPMFLASLLMWAVYASAETALHKRVFLNYDAGFFPLRFGADEIRVMGAQFMVYLMVIGVYFLGIVAMVIIAVAAGVAGEAAAILAVILGILLFVGFIIYIWFLAHFSIRMAPAAALTVKTGRLAVTDGWAITKKRTGNLFLAYLLIFIVGYVVISVVQMAAFSAVLNENYFALMSGLSDDNPRIIFEQIGAKLKQPGTMIWLVISAVLYVIVSVVWWLSIAGVANYAVQWWDETSDESPLE